MATSVYRLSDNRLLTLAARTIINSRNAASIREAVAVYGYDDSAFSEAESLLEAFEQAVREKQDTYGRKYSATEALNDAWDVLHEKTYMPHVTIARMIFKNDEGVRRRLGLTGRRARTFESWLSEARRFYRALLADVALMQKIAERGITEEKLQDALEELDELEMMDHQQEKLKARAQDATRRRDNKRRALANWLSDYQKIVRIALADRPDLTEQFNLVARSA